MYEVTVYISSKCTKSLCVFLLLTMYCSILKMCGYTNLDSFGSTYFTTHHRTPMLVNNASFHAYQLSNGCSCFTSSLAITNFKNGTFQKLLFHCSSLRAFPVYPYQLLQFINSRHALFTPPTVFGGPIIVNCVLSSDRLVGFLCSCHRLSSLFVFLMMFVFVFLMLFVFIVLILPCFFHLPM